MKVYKAFLAILAASFIGIVSNPEMMMASDHVVLTAVDDTRAVETLIDPGVKSNFVLDVDRVPETEAAAIMAAPLDVFPIVAQASEESVQDTGSVTAVATTVATNVTTVATSTASVIANTMPVTMNTVPTRDQIVIGGNTVILNRTAATTENAGAAREGWYYENGRFIYAHNYDYVFGVLGKMYDAGVLVGMDFSVTLDGVTTIYTVSDAKVYNYNQTSARMGWIINGGGHSMALMTCYGDESRLVLFADA